MRRITALFLAILTILSNIFVSSNFVYAEELDSNIYYETIEKEELTEKEPELSELEVLENRMMLPTPSEPMFRTAQPLMESRANGSGNGELIGEIASWYPYYAWDLETAKYNGVDPLKIRYKDPNIDHHWVYCINAKKKAPDNGLTGTNNPYDVYLFDANDGNWIQNNYFQNPHTGYDGYSAAQGVFTALYRGFPNDTLGLKAKYNLTDWKLYAATQMAIHFWTDEIYQTKAGPTPWDKDLNNAFFELIDQKPTDLNETLGVLRANIYLGKAHTDGTYTQRVMWLDHVAEPEEPEIPEKPESTKVKFLKKNINGETLTGANLTLVSNKDTIQPISWISDSNVKEIELKEARYTLIEVSPPKGYKVAEPVIFDVSYNSQTNTMEINIVDLGAGNKEEDGVLIMVDDYAKEETTTVKLSKQDIAGNELEGATIVLSSDNGEESQEWLSDGKVHEFTVKEGHYTFTETKVPEVGEDEKPFKVATEISFDVVRNEKNNKLEVTNVNLGAGNKEEDGVLIMVDDYAKEESTTVKLSKQDIAGNELEGATIVLSEIKGFLIARYFIKSLNSDTISCNLNPEICYIFKLYLFNKNV